MVKTDFFSNFSAEGLHDWGILGYSFGIPRNKPSTASYGTAVSFSPEAPSSPRLSALPSHPSPLFWGVMKSVPLPTGAGDIRFLNDFLRLC